MQLILSTFAYRKFSVWFKCTMYTAMNGNEELRVPVRTIHGWWYPGFTRYIYIYMLQRVTRKECSFIYDSQYSKRFTLLISGVTVPTPYKCQKNVFRNTECMPLRNASPHPPPKKTKKTKKKSIAIRRPSSKFT